MLTITAFFLTQPNGFTSILVFTVPLVWPHWHGFMRIKLQSAESRMKTAAILTRWVTFPVLAFICLWFVLILKFDQWVPTRTPLEALGDVVGGGLMGGPTTLLPFFMAGIGIAVSIRAKRHRWLVVCLALSMGLYWISASTPKGLIRHALVGSWYQDTYRLAALVPIFVILLACLGMNFLRRFLVHRILDNPPLRNFQRSRLCCLDRRSDAVRVVAAGVLAAGFLSALAVTCGAGLKSVASEISNSFSYSRGRILSLDEYGLIQRLPSLVPANAVIAINPFNGGTLAYGLAGRMVTEVNLAPGPDTALLTLGHDFATAAAGSAACQVAVARNVQYILDFGTNYMTDRSTATDNYPGLVDVHSTATTILVARQGAAKLFKVTGCDVEP